jgi:hypothetical protein
MGESRLGQIGSNDAVLPKMKKIIIADLHKAYDGR